MNACPRRRFLMTSAALALAICAGQALAQPTHDQVAGPADLVVRDATAELSRTIVSGTLSEPHAQGRNILWCTTFQLAWNELSDALGGSLRMSGVPLADRLNNAPETRADLDDDSYVALAGFGRDGILDACREQLRSRFGGAADPRLLPDAIDGESIFAYAYLFKDLAFDTPFLRRPAPLPFAGQDTPAFGLWPEARAEQWRTLASQIVIQAYESPTEWSAELLAADRGDRLIVARLVPGRTLADTVGRALASLDSVKKNKFSRRDSLIVPIMNFDITRTYDELSGRDVVGATASGRIARAAQNIRFRLDQAGAVLKSEASMVVGAAVDPEEGKRMICDGPFLVMMLRTGAAHPYLALWVDNPELLVTQE